MTPPLPFATQDWLDHFRDRLNASPEFRTQVAGWNDDALYVVREDESVGFPESVAYYLKWQNGKVVEARCLTDFDRTDAVFRIEGPYSSWADAHSNRMDLGVALLIGKFTFRGAVAKAAANVVGEAMMVHAAYEIETAFLAPVAHA